MLTEKVIGLTMENETRDLLEPEIEFYNNTSICILIDAGFVLRINDGKITGIGLKEEN
jgi:hypothetical protein